jgi:hypothetical protein
METIIWSFKGSDVTFHSTENKIERDVVRMAIANSFEINHPIIIHNVRYNPTVLTNLNVSPICPTVETLQLGLNKIKPGKTTVQLCNVPGDVDKSDSVPTVHQPPHDLDSDSSTSDRVSE